LIKLKSKDNLNSSTSSFKDKEKAQRLIELSKDYQIGCSFGIAGRGLCSIADKIPKETLKIGRDASREIAVNSGKFTAEARRLITNGQFLSKIETVIKAIPSLHETEEVLKDLFNLAKDLVNSASENDFFTKISLLIEAQNIIINKIENNTNELKHILNYTRENILELNKQNIDFFIKYEKSKENHEKVNLEINKLLIRIKVIQLGFHNNNDCCESCRFCEKGCGER
jgi:hypothetical protein